MQSGNVMERVAFDITGPLLESTLGNVYILVVSDYFSRWVESYPIPNQESHTIAKVLVNKYFCRYGWPMFLHSDRGANLNAQVIQEICQLIGIERTRATAYHPQGDGLLERLNAR